MSDFWSVWITTLTIVSIVLVTWVLFANRKRTGSEGQETTGHEFDGITELENPLPAWWFYMFTLSIVWGVGYLIFYPGLGNYAGLLGWTQVEQHSQRVAAADARYSAIREQYLAVPVEQLAADPAANKMGARMFQNNCAQCHGADARGSYGFPNLTDADWQWGGSPDSIHATLVNGRNAAMPGWEGVIKDAGILQISHYVRSLSGLEHEAADATAGQPLYQTYCAACHGLDGVGNQALGAPNLTDDVWLYGSSIGQISHGIRVGRQGVMPAFGNQVGESKIHILTAYVYSLGQK